MKQCSKNWKKETGHLHGVGISALSVSFYFHFCASIYREGSRPKGMNFLQDCSIMELVDDTTFIAEKQPKTDSGIYVL